MITGLKAQLRESNPLGQAWLFGLAVVVSLPALLFSGMMPAWAPQLALLGLFVIFLLRGLAQGRLTGYTPIDASLGVLLLLLPVGLLVSAAPDVTRPLTYAFVANLALFAAVAAQRSSRWIMATSGWLLLAAGLGVGLIVLLGTRFGSGKLPFIDETITAALPGGWRAFWDQESFNPNISGGLLALFWLPAMLLAWQGQPWQQRDLAKPVALILTGLLLLTQSRGAILSALVGLMVITTLQQRRWLLVWALVIGAAGASMLYWGPETFLRATAGESPAPGIQSLAARQELWQTSFYLMLDFPLTGVGLGMVEPSLKQYYPSELITPQANIGHAHNIYLQTGAEMGLPGLMAHGVVYASLAALLYKQARRGIPPQQRTLAWGLLGSLIIFLIHGFFDAIIASPQVALIVWGMLGLMMAIATSPPPSWRRQVP